MKSKEIIIGTVLCALASFNYVSSGVFNYDCPATKRPMENFDFDRWPGLWYEVSKYSNWQRIFHFKCTQQLFMSKQGGYDIFHAAVANNGDQFYTPGYLRHISKTNEAKFNVSWPIPGQDMQKNLGAPHWILDTDYENYAITYSCLNFAPSLNYDYVWVLSRTPQLDEKFQSKIEQVLRSNKLRPKELNATTQDCGVLAGYETMDKFTIKNAF